MKKKLMLICLLCLASVCAIAQAVDTVAVVQEVDSLIQVSRALTGQRDFDQALEVNAAAEKIALEKLGRESAAYGSCCHNRGRVNNDKGDYSESERWYLEAKAIRGKVSGKENPAYCGSIINLGLLYSNMGDYEKAEPLLLEAKEIFEVRLKNRNHPFYKICLNCLGLLYQDMGDYEASEPLFLEIMTITEQTLGEEDSEYAGTLSNLGGLYLDMGNYKKAEPLFSRAKTIIEQTLGKEHPDYATTLNSLAILYKAMGNYKKAEPLYLEAKSIWEKTLGKESGTYAMSLNNLAGLSIAMGNYDKAEPLFLESNAIIAKTLGKEHPQYALSLENLANLYWEMSNYKKAEPLYLEAQTIKERTFGKEHPEYATCLSNIAVLYFDMGNYEKAVPLSLEAKAIREKALGKEHPDYAWSLKSLSDLHEIQYKYSASESLLAELSAIEQAQMSKATSFLSEQELAQYTAAFQKSRNDLSGYVLARRSSGNQTGTLPALAFSDALFYKGFLLTAASRRNALVAASSESQEINIRLKGYRQHLAEKYSKPIAEREGVAELEEKANAAEKELARTVAGYAEAIQQVNWQEVQAALKKDEAAIEMVHFRVNFPKTTDSTMYAALILCPGDLQPHFIPLFEEKELARLLRGAAGGSNFLKINALYAPKAAASKSKSLHELIWQPLESLLAGSKTVYCSPSGLLHRINLAAIPNSDGKTFGDSRQLVLLGSTRALVVPPVVIPSGNSAYLAGGIRYDTDSTAIAYANRSTSGSRSTEQPNTLAFQPDSLSATRGGVLDYLPATATEVREIGKTLAAAGFQAKVDTGFYATEEVFRQLGIGAPSPRIVHLATHGYFFPDPVSKGQKANSNFGQELVFKISEHPMIRSGLIMAGAKQAWLTGKHPQGFEDGILTAYEISQMNLGGTELVVLSACETGLGDIMGNEGVYGLQRAFKIAGAKYLIMSLWKVDDRSTQEFMTAFYRHWLTNKQPVPQAFRTAQREVRAKRPGAYDWAGFVLIE